VMERWSSRYPLTVRDAWTRRVEMERVVVEVKALCCLKSRVRVSMCLGGMKYRDVSRGIVKCRMVRGLLAGSGWRVTP
jgi:hypothetical protein